MQKTSARLKNCFRYWSFIYFYCSQSKYKKYFLVTHLVYYVIRVQFYMLFECLKYFT